MAILQSMIHGHGTSNELSSGKVHDLQKLTRARRELVNERTSTKNLIPYTWTTSFESFRGKAYGRMASENNNKYQYTYEL